MNRQKLLGLDVAKTLASVRLTGRGIAHVGLRSKNLEKTNRFYRETLGLKPEPRGPGVVYIYIGRDLLVLHDELRGSSEFHFGLRAKSFKEVDKWRDLLRSKKVPIYQDITEDSHRSMKVKDPDGHWIEISTEKKKA